MSVVILAECFEFLLQVMRIPEEHLIREFATNHPASCCPRACSAITWASNSLNNPGVLEETQVIQSAPSQAFNSA